MRRILLALAALVSALTLIPQTATAAGHIQCNASAVVYAFGGTLPTGSGTHLASIGAYTIATGQPITMAQRRKSAITAAVANAWNQVGVSPASVQGNTPTLTSGSYNYGYAYGHAKYNLNGGGTWFTVQWSTNCYEV